MEPLEAVFIALVLGLTVVFLAHGYMVRKDGNWQSFHSWRSRKLVDGSIASGDLMRRWVKGSWQYRALTESEEKEDGELQVW
ncbi:hypothetical protein [Mesorhizobium japonicum]|uniref:Msl8030 protein n=1 Tax=Mesorhizobium japonicum (strain LMG 29417 / CECT 9101 / MAFF 303099) TaxID=266835 RepID=Q984F3_RHILO|nr:hypothetical protein [Mesorhizobium japonicum]BAB53677.1 msl8030 [Mesorhizobium japonicum MAFF 303099]